MNWLDPSQYAPKSLTIILLSTFIVAVCTICGTNTLKGILAEKQFKFQSMPNGYLFKWFEYEDLGTWASPCLLHGNLGRHCAVRDLNMEMEPYIHIRNMNSKRLAALLYLWIHAMHNVFTTNCPTTKWRLNFLSSSKKTNMAAHGKFENLK